MKDKNTLNFGVFNKFASLTYLSDPDSSFGGKNYPTQLNI